MSELTRAQKDLDNLLQKITKPAVALAVIDCLILSKEKIDLKKSIKKAKTKLERDERFSLPLLVTLYRILSVADSPNSQLWKIPKNIPSARVILDQFYTELNALNK